MTRKKFSKVLLVWLCIITLLMPFGSEVLAAALTSENTTAVLESMPYREGGEAYRIADHNVLKVVQENDGTFSDVFYCLNANLSLSVMQSYNYNKVGNLRVISESEVEKWANSIGISTANYNSLIYLLDNLYSSKLKDVEKDAYLQKAFESLMEEEADMQPPTTLDLIKQNLSDDDIDVVQQWAIWYFTNGQETGTKEAYKEIFKTFGTMKTKTLAPGEVSESTDNFQNVSETRQRYAAELYNYLIESAKNASNSEAQAKVYPSIDRTKAVTSEVDEKYYKVGPFKVNSGNTKPADFKLNLVAEGGDLSSVDYKVYVNGEQTTRSFDEIFDEEYYIYIPIENNTITSIKLTCSYTTVGERDLSLWTGTHDTQTLQPLVLIVPNPGEEVNEEIIGKIDQKRYDLALRKFVVSINGEAVTGRTPEPTADSLQKLANGTVETAEYTHAKNPLPVKKGDRIVYEFRIYNEGDLDAVVSRLVDYLPEGLTVIDQKDSTTNSRYKWNVDGNTLTNEYLSGTTIPAFDKDKLTLSFATVQLECEITGDLTTGKVLTNVAEILIDDGNDDDSNTNSVQEPTLTEDFSGHKSNKDDLSDEHYHYKGLEDDDDFEKLVIDGKVFDMSLQKFISKVNDENLSREPKVDVTPLNNGKDDANYTATKTPINVATGDIITFTLRVYNEGDISGYAEEITDYIPEGLGFLVNYNTNYNNRWAIVPDADSVKLSTITDGMKNLKVTDFADVDSLEDVDVVLGKTKVTSTALASSTTSTSNLIEKFDGTNLKYKDVQITCIVVAEDEVTLKNIAAITKEFDEDRNQVETDRGSEDRDSTPRDDINPDDYTTGNEDDDDYDVLKTDKKDFDLSLQKFITGVNDEAITNRAPTITKDENGNLKYNHSTDPVRVANGDLIKYTIRVYNEGEVDGYAAEVTDSIPTGLVFVTDNETNVKYGWKMYDKSGKETTDVNQAVSVKTTYLSKENSEDNIIKAFDKNAEVSSTNPDYKDVELVFKVDESLMNKTTTTSERTLINIAEISKNTDKDGNEIPDIDSTPGNGEPNEDDIDREQVYVEYFDLALEKNLIKSLVTVDGKTTELLVANGETIKVDVNRKKISKTTIKFVYDVIVRNEGEIAGYATEVTDYIPQGLSFNPADNPGWEQVNTYVIKTNALAKTLLQPGETAKVSVVLTWDNNENNMGEFVNVAEISEHWNEHNSPDVDSTPDNLVSTEDDYDDAPVYVSIVTGLTDRPYILLTSVVLVILGTGIILIKKYVL